jgi:hypothetical protein
MNYPEDTFADFNKGDAQHRLELYMQHRELRYEFDQMEKQENSTESHQLVIEPQKIYNKNSLFVKIKRCCISLLS